MGNEMANDFFYFVEETSRIDPKSFDYKKRSEAGTDWLDFRADVHFFESINRNTRGYLRRNVEEVTFTQKNKDRMARSGWYGEADHPFEMYENIKLTRKRVMKVLWTNRSHKLADPLFDDSKVNYLISTCPGTEVGRGLFNDILTGYIPAFSCRSCGDLKIINNKPIVLINVLITYDLVDYGGFAGANMVGKPKARHASIITEGAEDNGEPLFLQIPFTDLIEDIVKDDKKAYIYAESADGDIGIAGLTTDNKLHLVNDGLHIYAGINEKSVAMVKDFYRSFGGK